MGTDQALSLRDWMISKIRGFPPISSSPWLVYPYMKLVYLCGAAFCAMSSQLLLARSCVELLGPCLESGLGALCP